MGDERGAPLACGRCGDDIGSHGIVSNDEHQCDTNEWRFCAACGSQGVKRGSKTCNECDAYQPDFEDGPWNEIQ